MSSVDSNNRTEEFVALLGAHDRRLFGYILALVPNYADAEELAQRVRLRLWQQFEEYDPSKDFGAWARTIAHYLILAQRKKSSARRPEFGDELLDAIAAESAVAMTVDAERSAALRTCLENLSEPKRRLLLRYYSTRETMRDLATCLGRSYDSVRHSIVRTRAALAECVTRSLRRGGTP